MNTTKDGRFLGTGQGMLMNSRCYNINEGSTKCSSYFRLSYVRFNTETILLWSWQFV